MTSNSTRQKQEQASSPLRTIGRIILGLFLVFAGISHLTFARQEFTAQVPEWVPASKDVVVLASGVVDLAARLLEDAVHDLNRCGERGHLEILEAHHRRFG